MRLLQQRDPLLSSLERCRDSHWFSPFFAADNLWYVDTCTEVLMDRIEGHGYMIIAYDTGDTLKSNTNHVFKLEPGHPGNANKTTRGHPEEEGV